MNLHVDGATKAQFKFNEITSITGVKPYVLRFWESEFDQINPEINEVGQKYYSQADLSAIKKIKKLLFDEKLSIPQAKGYLDREMIEVVEQSSVISIEDQSEDLRNAFEKRLSIQDTDQKLEKIKLEEAVKKNEELHTFDETIQDNQEDLKLIGHEMTSHIQEQALIVADEIRNDVNMLRAFKDSDVVNLVSAKKKLSALVGKIDGICKLHNWS